MITVNTSDKTVSIKIPRKYVSSIGSWLRRHSLAVVIGTYTAISLYCYIFFLNNGLGLAYNDARSHLDIGRRVVEGLKPGLAQLGSVWLPLPHLLMVPTIWNNFMWHSGLSGAIQSMISFVATGVVIYLFLKKIGVGMMGRIVAVFVFAANINILYLQSTAMTELLLLATLTLASYQFMLWFKDEKLINFIQTACWIMLATLIRYEGWFLLIAAASLIAVRTFVTKGYKTAEGTVLFFCTLAGIGIIGWVIWNQLIFGDPLFFVFGPYSARAQQKELEVAGILVTKGNLFLSLKAYFYALSYNSYTFHVFLGLLGATMFWLNKKMTNAVKIASIALFTPFVFNVLALYFGHSVLFIQGLIGGTWFNVRYGIMMMPTIAIFIGYLVDKIKYMRVVVIGLLLFVTYFAFSSYDAVTIDDARVGSSQKNVSEVSGWLAQHASDKEGFILISAASHDAIIFSSGLPMKKFIHEGTGAYWRSALTSPDRWARWIIMRTNDTNDQVFKGVSQSEGLLRYNLVGKYPFADIYELKLEYLEQLQTEATIIDNK
jgi:hypothetical protein